MYWRVPALATGPDFRLNRSFVAKNEPEIMSLERNIRKLIALAIIVLTIVGVAAVLYLTDTLLDVWDRLSKGPAAIRYAFWGILSTGLLLVAWGVYRLLRPSSPATASGRQERPAIDAASLSERLDAAQESGIDVESARHELNQLARRNEAGRLGVALVGNISTGKSSLIEALIPGASPAVDVSGGSTRSMCRHQWQAESGDVLELVDLPGLSEADGKLEQLTLDEALRCHLVIFVCEGDLSRDEYQALSQLLALEKPLVLALNKKDRFDEDELSGIRQRLADRVGSERVPVVAISAGGSEVLMRIDKQGREEKTKRPRLPEVDELLSALERLLDGSPEALQQLRDRSVFFLVESRLREARNRHLDTASEAIVRKYTKRAVVGSLAAVSPGTDILIQGYLGTNMVRELCELYEVAAKQLDIDKFLSHSQALIGRMLPLMLAVVGNGLKAFPGVGTLTGGLVHAVAYGMIFDSLGHSLRRTLDQRGEFLPGMAAAGFKESLGENLESRSGALARLALESVEGKSSQDSESTNHSNR